MDRGEKRKLRRWSKQEQDALVNIEECMLICRVYSAKGRGSWKEEQEGKEELERVLLVMVERCRIKSGAIERAS